MRQSSNRLGQETTKQIRYNAGQETALWRTEREKDQ